MICINYEFKVPPTGPKHQMPDGKWIILSTLAWSIKFETICGENGKEIQDKAAAIAKAFDAIEFTAVGLHNRRRDWEEAFGVSDLPDTSFGDPPPRELKPESWWKWFR